MLWGQARRPASAWTDALPAACRTTQDATGRTPMTYAIICQASGQLLSLLTDSDGSKPVTPRPPLAGPARSPTSS